MDVKKLNRSLIEIAVSQGIREIRQDPKRGLRRLSDLGEHFASRWFPKNVFIQIHEVLKREDSRYYQMMEDCLERIDEDALKNFGINLGYCSWTFGVSKIRQSLQEGNEKTSWFYELPYRGEKEDPSTSLKKLSETIKKMCQKGVYTYLLYPEQTFEECPELIFLLRQFPDCAFLWFFQEANLTDAQLQMLQKHKNCIYLFPAVKEDDTTNVEIAGRLKQRKMLYSYYYLYDELEGGLEAQLGKIQPVLEEEPLALILKASGEISDEYRLQCAKDIWKKRMMPEYSTFFVEWSEDSRKVNEMIWNGSAAKGE